MNHGLNETFRVFFAIGPEDVREAYQAWLKGEESSSVTCVAFSSQFFDICEEIDAQGYIRTLSQKKYFLRDGRFTIDLRTTPFPLAKGMWFHLNEVWQGISLVISAIKFRADVVILDLNSLGLLHWYVFYLLWILGIEIITDVHVLLWHKYLPLTLKERFLLSTGKYIFSKSKANLVCSHEISSQISRLTLGMHSPIFPFFSSYQPEYFLRIPDPAPERRPFRVLFLGRVERNKGVFDLLEVAQRLIIDEGESFVFDICGDGSDLESLEDEVKSLGLNQVFICHGWCDRDRVQAVLSSAHAVVVPTRKDFFEGFNRVVCESVLARRPVITSNVCPALSYVREAAIEVPPEDVQAYGDALLALYRDRQLYEQKRQACLTLQAQFFSPENNWKNVLKQVLIDAKTHRGQHFLSKPATPLAMPISDVP